MSVSACLRSDTYACDEDPQCHRDDAAGLCVNGWCAYPRDDCESGFAFSDYADPAIARRCVPSGAETDAFTTADGGSAGLDPCDDGCDTPPGPCHEATGTCDAASDQCVYPPLVAGTPCDEANPCSGMSTCDGAGACVDEAPVLCDEPPSTCYSATGTCDPATGECEYALQPAGSPCDDGDGCTVGDVCDDTGACTPGAPCPSRNPCEVTACVAGTCAATPQPDGSSCGPTAAERCCGGSCVDISSDAAHCGGCSMMCDSARACETVAATSTCSPAPVDETGRCTCNANADCPNGQVCRTVSPFANRCAPENGGQCPGAFVDVASCPNYCTY